jgi:DHA3 family macrolide efflux protein-like MFS transporter
MTASQATPVLSFGAVLRLRVLRRLWYAQMVSSFGDFLALFAIISVVSFHLHGTPAQVTWVQISYLLPFALFGAIAGVFVDRWPLKPTMILSDVLRAALIALFIFATHMWQFYAVLVGISLVSIFFMPAQSVVVRLAVPREGLLSANALMQQVFFVMRIAGPAAAGLLVAAFGARICYIADSISFLASACLIASVSVSRPVQDATANVEPATSGVRKVFTELAAGLNFIVHHGELLFTISAFAAGMFIMGCFGPLVAIYVRENLHQSTRLFGAVSALIGFGLLIGTAGLRVVAARVSNRALVLGGLAGIALGLLLLAAIPRIAVTVVATLIIGLAVAAIIVPAQTLMQQETPPALLGRVSSTMMSIIITAQVLGLMIAAALTQAAGVALMFVLCAAFLLVLVAIGSRIRHAPAIAAP